MSILSAELGVDLLENSANKGALWNEGGLWNKGGFDQKPVCWFYFQVL